MKVLVTGSSNGIGLQIAKELSNLKHELVLHYNSTVDNLKKTSEAVMIIFTISRLIYLMIREQISYTKRL